MISIHEVYNDRKNEIEFYFSVMVEVDNDTNGTISTIDNQRFYRIMKSNFLLMLYNLVEATFTTGMLEIYSQMQTDGCVYNSVIDEIQAIWRESQIKQIYNPNSKLKTYTEKIKSIVSDITENTPLVLTKGMLNINGNLNAKQIKTICDRHRIRYTATDRRFVLEQVKKKRNSLAHGDESFSRCARDLTIGDLETIKDTVLNFISEIIIGMEKYCDEKQYLRQS